MLTLILKGTNACNLRCAYCSLGEKEQFSIMSEKKMSDALIWFAQYAKQRKEATISVIFHGGEPMLISPKQYRTCIDRLLEKYADLEIRFHIQTNGTILTEEYLQLIKEYDIKVGASLDGSAYVHDMQRKTVHQQKTYEIIWKNILHMKKEGISVSALMVLTKIAMETDLSYLNKLCEMDIPLKINPLLQIGEAKNHTELALELGDYSRYLIGVYEYLLQNDLHVNISPIEEIFQGIFSDSTPKGCTFNAECCKHFLCINQDGDIYPCGRFADIEICKLGTIEIGIEKQEQYKDLLEQRKTCLLEKCRNCIYLKYCNGGCNAYLKTEESAILCEEYQRIFSYFSGEGLKKYKTYLFQKKNELLLQLKGRESYEL